MAAVNGSNGSANKGGAADGYSQITILQEATTRYEKKVVGLRTSFHGSKTRLSIEDFLDYVAAERLRRIPHQGGRWDRVLKWAEYFADQVSNFEYVVHGFLVNSQDTAEIVYLCLRAMLDMGPGQAQALERAFRIFYEEAVTLSFYIRHQELFDIASVRQELSQSYLALVELVVAISMYYNRLSRETKSQNVQIDLTRLFGRSVRDFFRHKDSASNAMWTYHLEKSPETKSFYLEISTLRAWLGAGTSGLPVSISNPKAERAEFSCEWFQTHLSDFIRSKDDMLSIEGLAGSGKSVLSSWIAERLQRPIGRRYVEGISYFLDANIPSKSTSLSLVKGLLLQVLERDIGDVKLYKSLVQVYELSTRSGTEPEIEVALWDVLEHAVSGAQDMVLIVDGVNEVVGPAGTSKRVFDRLHSLATKYFGVRVITASQVQSTYPKTKHFTIKPEHTRTDVYNLSRHFFSTHHSIPEDDPELDKAAYEVADRSQGSFVTANLLLYLLAREKTKPAIFETLKKAPNVDGVLQILIDTALTSPVTKSVISWLLVSEDSLTVDEIRLLLETDVSSGTKVTFTGDVRHVLKEAEALVTIADGSVRFRHLSISEHLRHLANTGKSLPNLQTANLDLLSRILLHIKLSLTRDEEPGVDGLEPNHVTELYHDIPLLSYTIRHWASHFRKTTLYKDNGTFTFTPEFKKLFPTVTLFPLLEKTTWETSMSLTEVIRWHKIALTIRETVLGRFHKSVLQSYLNVATTSEKTGDTKAATHYYYNAFGISKTVVGQWSSLTVLFATSYWNLTKATKTTTRDDLTTSKEETLKYLVAHAEHEHDSTSDATLRYKRELAGLYQSINETNNASAVYKQIYDASVTRYGVSSKETMEVTGHLTATMKHSEEKHEDITTYNRRIFEHSESSMAVSDSRRQTATFQMADAYEAQKEYARAEEMYITLWQSLAQHASSTQTTESHTQLIDVVLRYVAFLRRHGRDQEASSILMGLWSEYEKKDIKSDAVAGRLTTVGRELRTLGVASVAVSIFASLWTYFKRTNRQSSKEAADVAINLTNTAKDVPDQTGSSTGYASILMEVFNSTFGSSKTVTIDASTIHTCETLSKYHVQQGHFSEAAEICARVLTSLWTSLTSFSKPEKFPEAYSQDAVDIAVREAYCRWKLSQLDRAEKIYLYIFRAAVTSMKIDDQRVTSLIEAILEFYKETHQTDKLIAFYEEVITSYRKSLGTANKTTITALYSLAALLVRNKRETRAVEIYLEIISALNRDSKVCHQDAFDAAIAVSNIYYESANYKSAQSVFAILWTTITSKAKEYGIREEFTMTTYERYVHILKTEAKADYATLRQLAIEYRRIAIAVYGAESEAAIQSTLYLAEISSTSKETTHQQEAIGLYEESFKSSEKSKTTNRGLLAMLASARGKLSSLYIANATSNSANSEKAVGLYKEQYERSRTSYGWSHHSTLDSIRGLVTLWTKSKDKKQTDAASKELTTTTTTILTTEKDSKALYDSAYSLAETYTAAGLYDQGWALLQELRRQIIYRDYSQSATWGFKLENINRSSYVFLSTFEEALQSHKSGAKDVEKGSFSVVMTDLLTESVLYEQYRTQVQKKTRIDLILLTGARIRAFLIRKNRTEQIKGIETELFELFLSALGAEIKTPREVTFRFFIIMLEELSKETHSAHLGNAACIGGNNRVLQNLKDGKFTEAYELATAVFSFVHAHRGYHHAGNVGSGFKLSLYMAGRGVPKPAEGKLRNDMITLSQAILRDTLDACKHLKIEFTAMQPAELTDLVALMGEQKNYVDLEWLLTSLWDSRHYHGKEWSSSTVVSIGRRLVECRFAHGHKESAIHLCQDICYNLRQVWGPTDKTTVEMNNLLSSLYTTAGRHGEAMAVHEAILREEVSDDNEAPVTAESAEAMRVQVELLKRTFQRNGKFDKDASVYNELWEQLSSVFGKDKAFSSLKAPSTWNAKDGTDMQTGTFVNPTSWELVFDNKGQHKNVMHKRRTSGYHLLMNGGMTSPKTVKA